MIQYEPPDPPMFYIEIREAPPPQPRRCKWQIERSRPDYRFFGFGAELSAHYADGRWWTDFELILGPFEISYGRFWAE